MSTPTTEGRLFLSASIPSRERWDGPFSSLDITDAVVALARVFLAADWELVTAAHPTISPLLLYVDSELPEHRRSRITIYQSDLFEDDLPEETRRFEAEGIARFEWTPQVRGDQPRPGRWDASLLLMRQRMLEDTAPDAAVFIGGMSGIFDEYDLFGEMRGGQPRFALGAPGGAARALLASTDRPLPELTDELRDTKVYPAAARRILSAVRG